MNTRLTVVMRRDLKLPAGAMCAQVAHVSDEFMRHRVIGNVELRDQMVDQMFASEEVEWMKDPYISVLQVDTLDELLYLEQKAKDIDLSVHRWYDTVHSNCIKVDMPEVITGISIGPADFDKISTVTGNLKLLYSDGVD
jgi:peptidyl-tRNA hydrolase